MDTSLRYLDYRPGDHFGNRVVAIHKANDAQRLLVGRFEAPDKLWLQRRTLQSSEQDLTGTPIGRDLFFFSVELRVHLPGRNRTDKMGV